MKIDLGDGIYFLAFRGTDDTIVVWREDFSISYKVVPPSKVAVDYLKKTMQEKGCDYRIGEHSKRGI